MDESKRNALRADFESIEIHADIQNSTTGSSFGSEPFAPRVIELHENGFVLEAAPRRCAVGHNLVVYLALNKGPTQLTDFEATVKVDELETLKVTPPADRIVVTLMQYEEGEWKEFKSHFSNRQSAIEQFLKTARGW